ncbi:MAG TPA: hypothetical protein PKA31_02170 [Candidatus Moranbacteria bacterium]|nr:hypothetical protein [Candidatus Moranbacteria bacterium]
MIGRVEREEAFFGAFLLVGVAIECVAVRLAGIPGGLACGMALVSVGLAALTLASVRHLPKIQSRGCGEEKVSMAALFAWAMLALFVGAMALISCHELKCALS